MPAAQRNRLADSAFAAGALLRAGIAAPERPDRTYRALTALRRWGTSPAAGYVVAAARTPDRTAIHDDRGSVTFAEVERRTNAIARGLARQGVRAQDRVAILCRNQRHFVEALIATSKLGADAVCMNTGFAAPQVAEICAREGLELLIHDEEFAEIAAGAPVDQTVLAWTDEAATDTSLDALAAEHATTGLQPPRRPGRIVILTSGTTGLPKGAARRHPDSLLTLAPLFAKIPLRARRTTLIAAPLFHTWGFGHFGFALALGSTLVLQRRFEPEAVLGAIERHRVDTLAVVPVMLQRMLDLPPATLARYDTRSLRVIAASGSALPGDLALRAMDAFGDVLYNLYGSTEVAWASVAGPRDLRLAPGTAGTPPRGTSVRIYDALDRELPPGVAGRIFVGNSMVFDGYTGGGGKPVIDGLLGTGDLGYLDTAGRLFVAGRDDEMIVSGGENVFPREVEDLLVQHPAVAECAVIGVDDAEFGERLRAFIVLRPQSAVEAGELQAFVRKRLARFKVPRDVVFLGDLPRNAAGKVLKRELRALDPV